MDFGKIIFFVSLVGGEVMRWLGKNWRVVVLVAILVIMVLVDIVT